MISAAESGKPGDTSAIIAEVCALMLPALVSAHDWNLRDAETIARGLALVGADEISRLRRGK